VTAAVVVDDAVEFKTDGGQQKETRRKRSPAEMKQIEELARAAIGFDAARGDVISVQNVSFAMTPVVEPPAPGRLEKVQRVANDWSSVLRYVLLGGVFAVVYLLLIRPVKKQFIAILKELPKRVAQQSVAVPNTIDSAGAIGAMPDTPDAKRAQVLKKQVLDKVVAQPAAASRLVQGWIGEGGH
jgi:flagellar M-ring protein FliF